MSSIHVLHVLNSAHGGSAMSTFELIETLKVRGIKSSLICFNNASGTQQKRISDLVEGRVLFIPLYWMNKRIRVNWWKRPLLELLSFWKTWRGYRFQDRISSMIKREGINLIHTSTILNPEGAIAAKIHSIPHLWHVRELIGSDKHFHFYNYPAWAAYVSENCDYLIANSSVTENCLLQFFRKQKIKCIPNGLKISEFRIKNHTPEKERIVVGMLGSVTSRWKNHKFFIRTSALFNANDSIEFRIYGSLPASQDSYFIELRELIKSLQVKHIRFEPFKEPESIMDEIDILFHPTDLESFGRIFVEAMAAAVPIVAINQGGSLEMVIEGVNGFLVPLNDLTKAASKISELAESSQLRNDFGKNGRVLAEQKYTLDKLGDKIAELYREVFKERE